MLNKTKILFNQPIGMKLKDIPHVLNIKGFYFPPKKDFNPNSKLASPLLITEFLPNKSLDEFLKNQPGQIKESKNIGQMAYICRHDFQSGT